MIEEVKTPVQKCREAKLAVHNWAGRLRCAILKLNSEGASVTTIKQKVMEIFLSGMSNPKISDAETNRMVRAVKMTMTLIGENKATSKHNLRKPSSAGLTNQLPEITEEVIKRKLKKPDEFEL
jgi:hypothetical protein